MIVESIGLSVVEQMLEMFLEGLGNKIFNTTSLYEKIIEVVDVAFQQTCKEHKMEWNSQILKEYFKDNGINSVDTLLDMTSDKIKEIMKCYPKDEIENMSDNDKKLFEMGLEKINEQWICDWRDNYLNRFSANPEVTNYLLLRFINEERSRQKINADKRFEDIKQLAQLIKDDIDKSRTKNMYDNIVMLNRSIYPFVLKRLTPGCSDMVIDIAYALTDIYDHVSEYEKSEQIGDLIYNVITQQNEISSIKELRMLTGCAYSIAIAKVEKLEKKKQLLEKAKERFQVIKQYIDTWIPDENVKWKEFLGMFESDYGAFYTNMADYEKNRNGELFDEYCKEALQHQEKGEQCREYVYECRKQAEEDTREAERALYQSRSNIAGLLYRIGKYDDAIKKHKEVLEYRKRTKKVSDTFLTYEYIAGAYIEKWRRNTISDAEKKECLEFLAMCRKYYEENGDDTRLNNIHKKISAIDKLD